MQGKNLKICDARKQKEFTFTNILGLSSIFFFFIILTMNFLYNQVFSSFFTLCKTNFGDSLDSSNFYVDCYQQLF